MHRKRVRALQQPWHDPTGPVGLKFVCATCGGPHPSHAHDLDADAQDLLMARIRARWEDEEALADLEQERDEARQALGVLYDRAEQLAREHPGLRPPPRRTDP